MAKKLEDFIATLPKADQQAIQQEAERLITEEQTARAVREHDHGKKA